MSSKKTHKGKQNFQKKVTQQQNNSTDTQKIIWAFDKCDKNGVFAFDINKIEENNHLKEIFEKMIYYECLTWAEIKKHTHDKSNKSKHHFLDTDGMSDEAISRIKAMGMDEETDTIFSFALQNKLRIIGIREGCVFHVVWYDPDHRFYPSTR